MVKLDNMHENMGILSRTMETIPKNQAEILEMKNTILELKNASHGLYGIPACKKKGSVSVNTC